jgi:hypothetical protein
VKEEFAMSSAISRHQLEREAKVLLRKLAADGSYLDRLAAAKPDEWGLMTARSGHKRPVSSCSGQLVGAMQVCGWIECNPLGCMILSNGGRAWLAAHGIPTGKAKGGSKSSGAAPAAVNTAESPLAWLAGRKGADGKPLLSPDMLQAGERLRRDFEAGQMGERVTSQWGASIMPGQRGRSGVAGHELNRSERALAARQRVWRALQHVGPGLSSILLEVCCLASGLEAAERHLKWPKRSARLVLLIALERLAQHYCHGQNGTLQAAAGLQVWGLPDYRPDLLGHLATGAAPAQQTG